MPAAIEQPCRQMPLECPHCHTPGLIAWDRQKPDQRLHCRCCGRWYRVAGGAELVPAGPPETQVEATIAGALGSVFADWSDACSSAGSDRLNLASWRFWRDLPQAVVVWLLAIDRTACLALLSACLMTAGTLGWLVLRTTPLAAAAPREPVELSERVLILAEAWLVRDFTTMRRFTLAEEADELSQWAEHSVRPAALDDVLPGEVVASLASPAPPRDAQQARVTVALAARFGTAADGGNRCQQSQMWCQREGKWYFSPKESLAQR